MNAARTGDQRNSSRTGSNGPLDLGATVQEDGTVHCRVWAPRVRELSVFLPQGGKVIALTAAGDGYFSGAVAGLSAGEDYFYQLDDGSRRPDPASRFQPEGVHGPSRVVAAKSFVWDDENWHGRPLADFIIYELHVGTFTAAGTFAGVIARLDDLVTLGITAVELMPVAQFPGGRNWGYDGTFPFAVQNSYGGPDGLKALVAACHARGLAVILDVVYNHLGPEGNYLHSFGPYFTDRYRTPWGDAVNFDGPESDPVRHYFIANARHWINEYHIDGLRLDAIHGIFDFSALHILQELAASVHELGDALGRPAYVIAESDLNDVRVINPVGSGGYGLDAQWNDDFHHALHTLLTGERAGYYADYGSFAALVKGFQEGFILAGDYSTYRQRRHGNSAAAIPPARLLVFAQNHDQVGNRMRGERLSSQLSLPQRQLVAATILLSPYLPLLFMGEEYGESAPFPYFVSHGDAALVQAIRNGRREEFAAFGERGTPPDPQAEATFLAAKLHWDERQFGEHQVLYDFYCALIRLRKACAPLANLSREGMLIVSDEKAEVLAVSRSGAGEQILCLLNYSDQPQVISPPLASGPLRVLLDGTGHFPVGSSLTVHVAQPETFPTLAPFGVVVYQKE